METPNDILETNPQSRVEEYLEAAILKTTDNLPNPQARVDYYLLKLIDAIIEGGGGGGGPDPRVTQLLKLIPTQASETNKLADKDFVNSTAVSQAAHYIYKTEVEGEKIPFSSLEELEAYSGTVTPNDYANVVTTDSAGNTWYDRYTAVETETGISWALQFKINNSSFTAVQWAAINSNITQALVALIQTALQGIKVNGVELTPGADNKPNISIDSAIAGSTHYQQITYYEVGSDTAHHAKLYIEEID